MPVRPVSARAQPLSQVSSDVSPDGMVEESEADVTRAAGGEEGQDRAVGS
jgi:hypothetical protein